MRLSRRNFLVMAALTAAGCGLMRPETLAVGADDSPFQATFSLRQGLIAGLKRRDDAFDTDYLKGHGLGKVEMRYRTGGGDWQFAASLDSDDVRQVRVDDEDQPRDIVVDYDADSTDAKGIRGFSLQEHFRLDGDRLHWQITLRNRLSEPLEIGDLALPMLFNTDYVRDSLTTYTQRVVRHSHIAGHGSFVVALRPNGVGPFLAVLPDADTPLEYFERTPGMGAWEGVYTAFVHSRASGEAETRGAWRLPHTSRTLQPAGQQGDTAVYRFDLLWADDYEAARQALYDAGLLDIQVVPGMSLPSDLFAQLAIRTRQPIGPDSLAVEFPAQTTVEYLG
ncbi:MAG: twin-arginine translocation signal domain-containing protein, partial [Anaerolineae bacterium]|nr:twin-arginine translocation signal domain-containing protein [Anaerolineae bacterium]